MYAGEVMDWSAIITSLRLSGLTQQAIADLCGVSQPTISALELRKQKSVPYEIGAQLVRLAGRHAARLKAAA